MHITYHSRDVYGNTLLYINDENKAKAVQTLTGKKTIDSNDIKALQALGHKVERREDLRA